MEKDIAEGHHHSHESHLSHEIDSSTKIFLYTLMANIIILGITLLIFKKVRYWRDDDQSQRDKKSLLKSSS